MARPKKHPGEKRDQRFNLRFTVAEREHVEGQAAIAGLEPSEYLRRRALATKYRLLPRETPIRAS